MSLRSLAALACRKARAPVLSGAGVGRGLTQVNLAGGDSRIK